MTSTELLHRTELFAGLSERALELLGEGAILVELAAGDVLIREGEPGDSLFVVSEGQLDVTVEDRGGDEVVVGTIGVAEVVGEISMLDGSARAATVTAGGACHLWRISRATFDQVAEVDPVLIERVTEIMRHRLMVVRLRTLMSKLFPGVPTDALARFESLGRWLEFSRGDALYSQGDTSDFVLLLVGGSVGLFRAGGRDTTFVGERGRGQMLGTRSMLLREPRSATAVALRNTHIFRFERADVEALVHANPTLSLEIMRLVFGRRGRPSGRDPGLASVRAVVLPVLPSLDARAFGASLRDALALCGSVVYVDVEAAEQACDVRGINRIPARHAYWNRVDIWLERLSDKVDYVVLVGTPEPGNWNRWVTAHADHVLALAPGDAAPDRAALRRMLPPRGSRATSMAAAVVPDGGDEVLGSRRAVVLIHPPQGAAPQHSKAWRAAAEADRVYHVREGQQGDIERVARMVAGRATGLVFGGGGARGFVHVGVYKALLEHGVPIDSVGGTSMGSIIASQVASGRSIDEILEVNRRCVALKAFSEYTLPLISLVRTKRIEKAARISGADADIEDLWLDFFAVSTDLTRARMVVHDQGPVWTATRASGALPGIVRPVVRDGVLLVDGGLLNNLPTDVMRRRCGPLGRVIAVNASPESDVVMPVREFPSPYTLFMRYLARRAGPTIPSIVDILMRSFVLGSVIRLEETREAADLYIAPEVADIGMLEFARMDELVERGYVAAATALEAQ